MGSGGYTAKCVSKLASNLRKPVTGHGLISAQKSLISIHITVKEIWSESQQSLRIGIFESR